MEISNIERADYQSAYNIFCSAIKGTQSRSALYPTFCKIPVGGQTQKHAHYEKEIFFIINGEGILESPGHAQHVGRGDLITLAPFREHVLRNAGSSELTFLSVYSESVEVSSLPSEVVITAAPPTPNGPLHLGHLSGPYLAVDILARYLRLRSSKVTTHSGTDDHQNYVRARANSLGQNTEHFRKNMRQLILQGLKNVEVVFDQFIEPKQDALYKDRIQDFFERARDQNIIIKKLASLPFCAVCDQFLIDADLEGLCPHCENSSHGACENCGLVVPPQDLNQPQCARGHGPLSKRQPEVYAFPLSEYLPLIASDLQQVALPPRLRALVSKVQRMKNLDVLVSHPDPHWDGLTIKGSDQVLHVWFEMAAHYERFAKGRSTWIHAFGFDNAFYYLLFIPTLLRAMDPQAQMPAAVLTNEFLNLEGSKFSTSRNHAIWAHEFTGNPEHLRLYLAFQRPAARSSNFSKGDFDIFSKSLAEQLGRLKSVAASAAWVDPSAETLVFCNEMVREMEHLLSPQVFDLRRASRRLLEFMDALEHRGNEKLLYGVLTTLMAPFLPSASAEFQNILGRPCLQWKSDWSSELAKEAV